MKIKMSKLRQLIKEDYALSSMISAYNKIADLLPLECQVLKRNYGFAISIYNEEHMNLNILECDIRGDQYEHILNFLPYGADSVSDDWVIDQSNCKTYHEMDSNIKDAVEYLLTEKNIALKDDIDNLNLD